MFATTFLGHQGWLFQSAQTNLLVDPLLCEDFGGVHALGYRVFPPREFIESAFPRIDAVMLTHEHDDHFDIPSLAKLDRSIPIFLSAHSSTAAYNILCAMGFSVNPLVPGVGFACGDLEVLALTGDHVHTNCGDEWDTLPFLIRQAAGAGSFFSMVDCTLTQTHLAFARTFVPKPGLVGWTNNAQDWSHMIDCVPERTRGTEEYIKNMRESFGRLTSVWGKPSGVVLCAGGFAFQGERAWLNRRVFCVDTERVVKAQSSHYAGQRFFAGRPGQTFYMEQNQLKRVDKQTPFLGTAPPESWAIRDKAPLGTLPDYAPATGRREPLSEAELQLLQRRLGELAGAMVGGGLFKNLHSLLEVEGEGRMGTFCFVLRQGEAAPPLVFLYNASGCTFDLAPFEKPFDTPRALFIAGMECWAADLLAVLGGELGALGLMFGRASLWNALPSRLDFDIFGELMRTSHPLRRPAEYLRTYERIWEGCRDVKPTILGREG